jgi:hypothetical protein
MNSAQSSGTFQQDVKKIGLKKGRMELLTNLLGYQALQNHQRMSEANQEAENQSVRRRVWGSDDGNAVKEGGEMGNTILGDVTPAPVVVAGQTGHGLGTLLAAAALGSVIPLAGVGGYLLSQAQTEPPPVVAPADESVELGLGQLEDYLARESN